MDWLEIWPWLGLDSLLACAVLSPCSMSWRERCVLAAAFGLWDAAAAAVSPLVTPGLPSPLLGIYLLAVLLLGYRARSSRFCLLVLPMGLSIDNLFDHTPLAGALSCGLSSALLALLGMQLPRLVRHLVPTTLPRRGSMLE